MEDLQKKVLERALSMLSALKCEFAIITPEGEKFGALVVTAPKAEGKRTFSGIKYKPLYQGLVEKITPDGELHKFTVPDEVPVEGFRAALCGYCSSHWGKETYSTQVKGREIHLMRWS